MAGFVHGVLDETAFAGAPLLRWTDLAVGGIACYAYRELLARYTGPTSTTRSTRSERSMASSSRSRYDRSARVSNLCPASSRTEANDSSPQPPAHRARRVARLTGRPARGIGEDPLAAVEISPAGRRSGSLWRRPVGQRPGVGSVGAAQCVHMVLDVRNQPGAPTRRATWSARPARPAVLSRGPDAEPGPGTIPVRCGHGAVLVLSIAGITLTAVESTSNGRSLARRQ
jgi:hypothetical protein